MKKFIIAGTVFVVLSVIYFERNNMQTTAVVQTVKKVFPTTKIKQLTVSLPRQNSQIASNDDVFSKIDTVDSLISQNKSLSENELREKVHLIKKTMESRKLIAKANEGTITKEERIQLVYYVRLNTALYHLLLDKQFGG